MTTTQPAMKAGARKNTKTQKHTKQAKTAKTAKAAKRQFLELREYRAEPLQAGYRERQLLHSSLLQKSFVLET